MSLTDNKDKEMGLLGLAVLVALLQTAIAQDANCDFNQDVQPGATYYIYSPGYSSNYTGARQCRWIGTARPGYVNVLSCTDIWLPFSQGCSLDRLLISRSGDPSLSGADVYCGRGTTTATSTGQRISVALITASTTPGGRFYCELRAQGVSTTPPPVQCNCGYKKSNRIVGGQETGVNEYPMMAGLVDTRIYQIKCGGTIIDKRYVLTAAHCTVGQSNLAVVVGEHNVNTGDSPATQALSIQRIINHPQYNPTTYDNDIAILRLNSDIAFSDRVGPACLPFKFANTDLTGKTVTILGWGTQFFGGPSSNTLQKVDVTVINQSSCRNVVSTLTSRQLCTYTPGKDACQDDSGGPALYTDPATGWLFNVGVISYGRACASGDPGVNTRVAELLSWVVNNTPEVQYCRK